MFFTYEYIPVFHYLILGFLILFSAHRLFSGQKKLIIPYLFVILLFTGTQYGLIDSSKPTIYSRGTGVLLVSFINIYLVGLFLFSFLINNKNTSRIVTGNRLPHFFFIMFFLLTGYYFFGLFAGLELDNVFSYFGLLNFYSLFMLFMICIWNIYDQIQLDKFFNIFKNLTGFMAVYGLVRLIFFGGDPANYYKNFQLKPINISFFDIGQNAIFCIIGVFAFLTIGKKLKQFRQFYIDLFLIFFCLLNILLSFRRTAWFGLMLVLVWLALQYSKKQAVIVSIISLLLIVFGINVAKGRFDTTKFKLQDLFPDITISQGRVQTGKGRFGELYKAASITLNHSPIVGLGPWAVNSPRANSIFASDFVHSSIIHVFIKTGIIGVILYCSMLFYFISWWLRIRKKKWNNDKNKAIAEAFFCGFVFLIADICFGTPQIIFRHSQIYALLFSVPIVCYEIDKRYGKIRG